LIRIAFVGPTSLRFSFASFYNKCRFDFLSSIEFFSYSRSDELDFDSTTIILVFTAFLIRVILILIVVIIGFMIIDSFFRNSEARNDHLCVKQSNASIESLDQDRKTSNVSLFVIHSHGNFPRRDIADSSVRKGSSQAIVAFEHILELPVPLERFPLQQCEASENLTVLIRDKGQSGPVPWHGRLHSATTKAARLPCESNTHRLAQNFSQSGDISMRCTTAAAEWTERGVAEMPQRAIFYHSGMAEGRMPRLALIGFPAVKDCTEAHLVLSRNPTSTRQMLSSSYQRTELSE
jgi:hypothetical protein